MLTKVAIVATFLLGVYFTGVSGTLMCYKCNSYTDKNPACSDPMGANISMVNCTTGYICSKVVYTTKNITVTSRGCDLDKNTTCASINATIHTNYKDASGFVCRTCNKDHCNSAVTFGVPIFVIIIGTLLSTKFI